MVEHITIAVGVDGSPSSEAAVRYAAHMAGRCGGRLHLVHVVSQATRAGGPYAVVPAYFEGVGRTILHDAMSRAGELLGPERVTGELRHGTRVACLLASTADAQAIVLGFDPRPTLERLATGSTVNGVAARARVPVVVVRPAWSPTELHRVVAVGVKSTDDIDGLLRRAFDAASGRAALLRIVHAWAMPTGYDDAIASRTEAEAVSLATAEQLRVSAAGIAADYPEVEYDIVAAHGHPARVLATMTCDADLLLLERRAPQLFPGHLGDTARTLLRSSECPVVIVPSEEVPAGVPASGTAGAAAAV